MTSQAIVSTEIERQREYLSRLPQGFQFSLFNYKVALESQRKSAYKTTTAAAREIVDNSIEAGCSQIDIVFRQGKSQSGHTLVDAIAFIDNGPGMLPEMTRYALCWGGGTHYDAPNHIGRFGFGLPNSSINQTRLVEVYSRTAEDEPIYKCRLNIDEFVEFGIESIPEPAEADLPEFVQRYLERNGQGYDHGTVVVWLNPDRLTYKRSARLKEHMVEDFGVVYRDFLLNPNLSLDLTVDRVKVRPVHPLFMEPEALYYEPPSNEVEAATGGGARQVALLTLFTKLSDFDPNRGAANQFVFGLFLNALKKVQRQYSLPPPVDTQYLSRETGQGEFTIEDTVADGNNDTEPSAERLHIKEAARQIIEQSEVTAPSKVKKAVRLLHTHDELSMNRVAGLLAVDRVTLTRQVRAWATQYEHLVAA